VLNLPKGKLRKKERNTANRKACERLALVASSPAVKRKKPRVGLKERDQTRSKEEYNKEIEALRFDRQTIGVKGKGSGLRVGILEIRAGTDSDQRGPIVRMH